MSGGPPGSGGRWTSGPESRSMRIVIAPDKFKGCLPAGAVAKAMALGAARAGNSPMDILCVPMADGGEGTADALVEATSGTYREANVHGPLGEPRSARYGWLEDGPTAVLEMAAASGLVLVPADRRDPTRTSTGGTGELLIHAALAGAKRIILGIGGSATNDGGAGLAQAL
ncbi:MAG: glycerate kinase, partial [Isosphaeraceae bacterium]